MATNQESTPSVTASSVQIDETVTNTNNQDIGWRQKLLIISEILYPLACTGYNFYLVWLLAYLKDNRNYWFLSFVAVGPLFFFIIYCPVFLAEEIENRHPATTVKSLFKTVRTTVVPTASAMVIINLMVCFTMLNRLAYYHVQPDKFIGPRFVIISLQGSIILFLFGFLLQRHCKVDLLLKDKDVLTRAVLDFVDIFNLVEFNRVGMSIYEGSSTEMAIQAFCTMSFFILLYVFAYGLLATNVGEDKDNWTHDDSIACSERIIHVASIVLQNLPFLVIRIVIWARHRLYGLGFLMKNVVAILVCSMQLYKFSF